MYKKIPELNKITMTTESKNRTIYAPTSNEKDIHIAVKNEIEDTYSITYANRNLQINQIINFFTQQKNNSVPNFNTKIIRSDIKNFFPSVNKHLLYQKLMHKNYLSINSISVIKEFIFNSKIIGIPQGISISSALAEFYLLDFDINIKNHFNPSLYLRYVDDIIIIKYVIDSQINKNGRFYNQPSHLK